MELTIKLEFTERTEELLGLFLNELKAFENRNAKTLSAPIPEENPFPAEQPKPKKIKAPKPEKTVEVAPVEEAPVEEPKPELVKVSLEDVRAKVMELCRKSPALKSKVREALNKYAESVPQLAEADLPKFFEDLKILEGAA